MIRFHFLTQINTQLNRLGYVGPDDREIFANVIKVTSLLNKTHVLPYKIDVKERPSNVFFIGADQTAVRARVKLSFQNF